ncbi:MAG: PAS domain S-box protein [Planctomycetes bacterium]|nr:PAS domain S-box protein [Planctomycetota bacterium]
MNPSSESGHLLAEIERLKAREREWFAVAEAAIAREKRALEFARALAQLSRSSTLEAQGLRAALLELLQHAGRALGARRVGVWIFDDTRRHLECLQLVDFEAGHEEAGQRIDAETYPAYFAALEEERVIAAGEARRDPRTRELTASYLEPFGLEALLDAPVRVFGRAAGVVCHEFTRERDFGTDQQTFAATIADFVALALERRQRREAEDIATASEAKYRHLVESLPAVIYSFDPRGRVLDYVSPQIEALTGVEPQNFLAAGRRWWDTIQADDREAVRAKIEAAIARGMPLSLEYRLATATGAVRWVRDSFRIVRNAEGAPLALQGMLEDVTELKLEAVARAEHQRRFKSLLDSVQAIAVVLDRQGRVTYVNDFFLGLVHRTRADVVGQDWFDLHLPPEERERVRALFLDDLRRGEIVPRYENHVVAADGERRQVLWSNTLLRDSNGEVVGTASLGVDVTDKVRIEEERLLAQKKESLGRMAAGVAHDFNNLLTVILGGLESALLETSVADHARADLERALLAASRAKDLTGSLLSYARKRTLVERTFEIDPMLRESVRLLRSLVGPTVDLRLEPDAEHASVRADPALLEQVIVNLGVNARDAVGGHGTVRISSEVVLVDGRAARAPTNLEPGPYVRIAVTDDGPGIPSELVARIFDPFFTTKAEGTGVGLGLSSALGFVQQAKGDLVVESAPGRGATFAIYLPRVASLPDALASPAPSFVSPEGGERVLLVEDQELVRHFVAASLANFGYDVRSAADFDEALGMALSNPDGIDVVVTDLDLPGGSGVELARRLQAILSHAAVLVISGFGDVAERAAAIPGVSVLPKPFTPVELASRIRELVTRPES